MQHALVFNLPGGFRWQGCAVSGPGSTLRDGYAKEQKEARKEESGQK
jgi:hypothetical protein